jgi:hypothetical protein
VIDGAAEQRPRGGRVLRPYCVVAAGLVLLVALAPPLGVLARRTEYAASLQFSLLAIAVPALTTLGAPWRQLGLARRGPALSPRPFDVLAERRHRHQELSRSIGFVGADLAAAVASGGLDSSRRRRSWRPASACGSSWSPHPRSGPVRTT